MKCSFKGKKTKENIAFLVRIVYKETSTKLGQEEILFNKKFLSMVQTLQKD